MAAPVHALLVLLLVVLYRFYFSVPSITSPQPLILTPPDPLSYSNIVKHMYASPAVTKKVVEPPLRVPTVFVPDYVSLGSVQKCLEDRRSDFVSVNSATFSAGVELEKRPYQRFLVLESDHFVLFSNYHPPVTFSYKSRNAVMSRLWRSGSFPLMAATKYVEVDGLWQLEQPPVLYFVFGKDADTLHSDYLVDDNTISEYYEETTAMDMSKLAAVARSRAALCLSHFFVVNRSKDYWAVDTNDPSISYAFGPSTKTRTISRLADGLTKVQALIDEDQPLATSDDARTSQSPNFKLRDVNGEEVIKGEEFALHILSGRGYGEDEDTDEERRTMFDGKDWLHVFNHTNYQKEVEALVYGSADSGSSFRVAVVDGVTYITFEGQFLQMGGADSAGSDVVVLPHVPLKHNRIRISYTDSGDLALSQWGTENPIVCEWVKFAYGAVMMRDSEEPVHARHLLKLGIVKI
ncbi:hypothetical protein IWW47_001345 [Coemansia sp. RSA 2052]|nr:hypothetical protein IWW47_001345 [Coemansia sp. RSA 2052]